MTEHNKNTKRQRLAEQKKVAIRGMSWNRKSWEEAITEDGSDEIHAEKI